MVEFYSEITDLWVELENHEKTPYTLIVDAHTKRQIKSSKNISKRRHINFSGALTMIPTH